MSTISDFGGGVGELVLQAAPMAKIVLLILLSFSVVCWALMADKIRQFRGASRETDRFLRVYRESKSFSAIYAQTKRLRASPLARVFQAAYQELGLSLGGKPVAEMIDRLLDEEDASTGERLGPVDRAMRRATAAEIARMERYLPFLATTASSAPFIGLFGTVWGIMSAFQNIGRQGSANLAVVAPGISEALIATAAGLAAAIPAVIAYNYFVNRVKRWATEMDNFSIELLNLLDRGQVRVPRSTPDGH